MSNDLCHSFLSNADWVWRKIETANRLGMGFGETAITEQVLIDIANNHPSQIHIKAFSQRVEGKNGADWEWWFGAPGRWIGMRVQAKRIKLPKETFSKLDYKTQMQDLIRMARKSKRTPLYCFYTYSQKLPLLGVDYFNNCSPFHRPFKANGCLIGHAQTIQRVNAKAQNSKALADLSPVCLPWHTLACQSNFNTEKFPPSQQHPADHVYDILKQLSFNSEQEFSSDDTLLFKPRETLPDELHVVEREGIFDGEGELEEYAEEMNLGGVFVMNLVDRDD